MRNLRVKDAIREAILEEMEQDKNVILLGEDIATYGGVFGCTKGLLDKFGPARVRNVPLSESAQPGVAIGAAIAGLRPILEIMYMDWFGMTLDQLVNNANLGWVWGGQVQVPMVIRVQVSGGRRNGPHHSKSLEVWPAHIPGIKVVMPSNAYDFKGLLKSAIRDNNPVIFIENALLYGSIGEVPEEDYVVKIGSARITREGTDITVIAFSDMVQEALAAAEILKEEGIDIEIIDPRSIVPMDYETIFSSIKKTHKVLIVHSSWKRFGIGAEIAATIQEEMFDSLDAPIKRLGILEVPIPASPALEPSIRPDKNKIIKTIKEIVN